jgi:hypothetical protein
VTTKYPTAKWKPLTTKSNFSTDAMTDHLGLILHVCQGNGSQYSWFNDPKSQVSSTFWVGKDGTVEQYVDADEIAYAQGNGNGTYNSVETEGFDTESLTSFQVEALAGLYTWGHATYAWPYQVSDSPGTAGFGWHGMGGADWSGHFACPGDLRKAQRAAILQVASTGVAGSTSGNSVQWGQSALSWGEANATGKPYVWGGEGDAAHQGGYDCSGLMVACYKNGAKIDLGARTVSDLWTSGNLLTVYTTSTPGAPPIAVNNTDSFQAGDLVIYINPHDIAAGSSAGHVRMFKDQTTMFSAEQQGTLVGDMPIDYNGGPSGYFMGLRRVDASLVPKGEGGGADSGSSGNDTSKDKHLKTWNTLSKSGVTSMLADLSDPRDNLPFSTYFLGQQSPGFMRAQQANISDSAAKALGFAGQSGSIAVPFPGVQKTPDNWAGVVMPGTTLIRGGMRELYQTVGNTNDPSSFQERHGGGFKCYFMMNPTSLSCTLAVDTNTQAAPTTVSQAVLQTSTYPLQNQSYSFTIIFNRMYEVWQGNVHNPHPEKGGPEGPSDLGVRWDIRALERLMGMYDALQAAQPGTPGSPSNAEWGQGNMGAGSSPPMSLPVQVVFGKANSIQFQGLIASIDYTYTMFSKDMIPVEASVDIGVMRLYLPQNAQADLANQTAHQYMGVGGSIFSRTPPVNPNALFNSVTGQIVQPQQPQHTILV